MAKVLASTAVVSRICEQLSDDKNIATGEVMAAAALVAITAGLADDQAVDALKSGLKAIRHADQNYADHKAVN